jgi:hypothetical protein
MTTVGDTTPRSGNDEPERPDSAPRWFIVLIVLIIVLGGLWFLLSAFGWGRAL